MINSNHEEQLVEFVSFCIENFKVKYGMSGKDVAALFKESQALNYLKEGYEILHTQSKDYIIDEIEIYLKNRGYRI